MLDFPYSDFILFISSTILVMPIDNDYNSWPIKSLYNKEIVMYNKRLPRELGPII